MAMPIEQDRIRDEKDFIQLKVESPNSEAIQDKESIIHAGFWGETKSLINY